MSWDSIVSELTPYIVRIDTPVNGGSGFVCLYNDNRSFVGIATAAHVVTHADEWQQPIRLWHPSSGESRLIQPTARVIYIDYRTDSAVILVANDFPAPTDLIPLYPVTAPLPIGGSVGWLGFPAIARATPCFFAGTVSAVEDYPTRGYLIDGVAINGVSGGPVVYASSDSKLHVVGILSAYRANRQSGEALPGLSFAQDVSHFHGVIETIRSYDEAERKKREFNEAIQSGQGAIAGSETSPKS